MTQKLEGFVKLLVPVEIIAGLQRAEDAPEDEEVWKS
jgi:hypothetical protein